MVLSVREDGSIAWSLRIDRAVPMLDGQRRCLLSIVSYASDCLAWNMTFAVSSRRPPSSVSQTRSWMPRGRLLSFLSVCSVDRTDSRGPALTLTCVGGGYWSPDARALAALRITIDKNPQRLKEVLMNDTMRAEFLSGSSMEAAVKSFVKTNSETALKTKPKVSSQRLFAPTRR
jgi:hypothetical protein